MNALYALYVCVCFRATDHPHLGADCTELLHRVPAHVRPGPPVALRDRGRRTRQVLHLLQLRLLGDGRSHTTRSLTKTHPFQFFHGTYSTGRD